MQYIAEISVAQFQYEFQPPGISIQSMKAVIIIPARYHSTRFPGKPLISLAGKTLLNRVCDIALYAATRVQMEVEVIVATDDQRIVSHAESIGVQAVRTPQDCETGTDRAFAAVEQLKIQPDAIVNLQGDAPLTPVHFVEAILRALSSDRSIQWVTPVAQLSWQELDQFRENKKTTPFSGTTVILDHRERAVWFSKNIIPAIRDEKKLRDRTKISPVYRHVGLYGCTLEMLRIYANLSQSPHEILEGLEQLRLLENGYQIRVVKVRYGNHPAMSGVDTPEDAKRAEDLIRRACLKSGNF